jgi:hypothetical protein
MGKETVTTPGNKRRIQVRKARADGFSEAKRQVFLDTLAMCCTVTAANSSPRRGREGPANRLVR